MQFQNQNSKYVYVCIQLIWGGGGYIVHTVYNIQKVQVTEKIALANIKLNTILFNCYLRYLNCPLNVWKLNKYNIIVCYQVYYDM